MKMQAHRKEETGDADLFCHTSHRSNALQNQQTNSTQESDEENNALS
jgi:hypothetical protein